MVCIFFMYITNEEIYSWKKFIAHRKTLITTIINCGDLKKTTVKL